MARGHKTGGRQKGTPNKRNADYDAKFAEAAERPTACGGSGFLDGGIS